MALKLSEDENLNKNLSSLKGKKSTSHIYLNDDSGYSSDSSSASACSSRLHLQNTNVSKESSKNAEHFPTPNINWKRNLRFNSTPVNSSSKSVINELKSLDITPVEGPLLRSKTYPNYSSTSSLNLNLSLNISESTTECSPTFDKPLVKEKLRENEKKGSFSLRSPLKSPFKLFKKQKSTENVKEDVFANPEVKQRTVKALFASDSPCTSPIRRSQRLRSNIITRMMIDANYLLPTVFSYLNDKDLLNASHVCQMFKQIVEETSTLKCRKNLFISMNQEESRKLGKENFKNKSTSLCTVSSFNMSSPRKHLQQLQNSALLSPQKASSPIKPLSRFEKFVREGKKLLPGETQQKCVLCQNPARISVSEAKAVCSDDKCAFIYCIRCHQPYHEKPSECLALQPKPKVSSCTKIFSKACKKRLRRL